jgi:hypothetical protein
MSTDMRLDQVDGSFLELDARVVKVISSDFMLDQPSRRKGGGPHRRALVHDQNDGLTINFNGDYPGGVTLVDLKTLQVRGDITFGIPGTKIDGGLGTSGTVMVPVSLTKTISELQAEINQLAAKVAALEAQQ